MAGRKQPKPTQRCTFCPRPATTSDHIPPKGLFAQRPSNLITVPACEACNNGTSDDDEYFRQIAMAAETVSGSPDADPVSEKIIRSFQRKEARGFREKFFEDLRPVSLWTTSGLYAGESFAYSLESDRLMKTCIKIVKDLFYHTTGQPLPEGYEAIAVPLENFCQWLERITRLRSASFSFLQTQPETEIGRGVFSYRTCRRDADPNTSLWLLQFYRSVRFIGGTARNVVAEASGGTP